MLKDSFQIVQIPETPDIVNKIVESNIEIIISNYVCLIKDLINITMYALNNDIVKPFIEELGIDSVFVNDYLALK